MRCDDRFTLSFAGRLSEEKGFDRLLVVLDAIWKHIPIRLLVAGSWPLERLLDARADVIDGRSVPIADIDSLASRDRVHIIRLGWRTVSEVLEIFAMSDGVCMPSRFVETFGYSALEALSVGTPVIGPRVGGLEQFIPEELAIDVFSDDAADRLAGILAHIRKHSDQIRPNAHACTQKFTKEAWLEHMSPILWSRKKILLVSDYIDAIGGTERHVLDIADALSQAGCDVRLFGKKVENWRLSKSEKIRDMLATFARGWGRREVRTILDEFRPEIVWTHGITKVFDIATIERLLAARTLHIHTYHDFSLFHPFASAMRGMDDMPVDDSLFSWLACGHTKNPPKLAYLVAKYFKVKHLRNLLSHADFHIVPSEFLSPVVERFIRPSRGRILTVAHFLR